MNHLSNRKYFEGYHPDKLEEHKRYLQLMSEQGTPQDFEIEVDGRKAVIRTNDVNRFDNYHNFLTENSRTVSLSIYWFNNNNARQHDKYLYKINYFRGDQGGSLNGLDLAHPMFSEQDVSKQIEDAVSKAVEKERQYNNTRALEEKNQALFKQLQEAEEYQKILSDKIERLEQELLLAKTSKYKIGNIDIVDAGVKVVSGVIREGFTGFMKGNKEDLSGINQEDNDAAVKEKCPDPDTGNVSFQMKEESNEVAAPVIKPKILTEAQKGARITLIEMEKRLPPEALHQATLIMQRLMSNPAKMTEILIGEEGKSENN
jgi:hypothetical protein